MTGNTFKLLGAFALCLVVASAASVNVDANSIQDSEGYGFEECLRKDSISCVQHQVYRHLRSFFDQKSVELPGGFALVKEAEPSRDGRSAEEVLPEGAVEDREEALETFAVQKASEFFSERSLRWNVQPLVSDVSAGARALMDYVPTELKAKVTSFMTEGEYITAISISHLSAPAERSRRCFPRFSLASVGATEMAAAITMREPLLVRPAPRRSWRRTTIWPPLLPGVGVAAPPAAGRVAHLKQQHAPRGSKTCPEQNKREMGVNIQTVKSRVRGDNSRERRKKM